METAQALRRRSTLAEQVLWAELRRNQLAGLRFRRQHPLGRFVVDFACPEHRLVIEIDGSIHDEQQLEDGLRTVALKEMGYRVIRFSNDDVLNRLKRVLETILECTHSPSLAKRERGPGGEG